jgi:preprotein translocase subunit YajC
MFATSAHARGGAPAGAPKPHKGLLSTLTIVGLLVLATPASAAASPGGAAEPLGGLLMPIMLVVFIGAMYFLQIRPQQKRAKDHQTMISAVKRGDTVVLSNGMVGKVTRVEDAEAMVEIATGVNARVIKTMIAEVRTRGEPVAIDAKS